MFSKGSDPVEKLFAYLTAQLENLSKQLAQTKAEVKKLHDEVSRLKKENEELKREIETLKNRKTGVSFLLLPKAEAEELLELIKQQL